MAGLSRYRRYISAELQPFFPDDEIHCWASTPALGTRQRPDLAQPSGRDHRAFAEVPAGRLRVLAIHHPLAATAAASKVAVVGRTAMAFEAITEAGVRLVLSGHYHRALSSDLAASDLVAKGSILFIHAGTAISTRLRGEPNSYNLLRLAPPAVTCTVRAFTGNNFLNAKTAHYTLLGGRWMRHPPVSLERVKEIEALSQLE